MPRDHDSTRPAAESGGMTNRPAAGREDWGADVGSLVRIRRRTAGLTQQELADLAQVSLGTVRDLEQGRTHRPRRDSMTRLAGVLGLDPARLQTLTRGTPEPAGPEGGRRPRVSGLQLKVLGPVEAWRDGTRAGLSEPRQRAVLGLLALNPDVPVLRETLIDALWPGDPPATAAHLLQTYVSRLRRVLDPGRPPRDPQGVLVSAGASYRLRVTADQLDLLAFRQLAAAARAAAVAGEPGAACDAYELALGLWRGEPAADVDALRGHPAAVHLSQARAAAVLQYAELADRGGRAEQVLGHLAELTAREPLNEKACARLMVTLAALGQQAAALHAYEQLRLRLDEQLGVLPGPELARAHLLVLRQQIPAAGDFVPRPWPWPDAASDVVDEAPGQTESPQLTPEAAGTAVSADLVVHPPADSWVAAVHASGDDLEPIGTAVVIDASRVLTCAHVAVTADGTPREPLWVSFPKADRWPRRRVAAATVAYSPPVNDLAVLVLTEPVPAGVEAAPLRFPRPADLAGRSWWAFGFPTATRSAVLSTVLSGPHWPWAGSGWTPSPRILPGRDSAAGAYGRLTTRRSSGWWARRTATARAGRSRCTRRTCASPVISSRRWPPGRPRRPVRSPCSSGAGPWRGTRKGCGTGGHGRGG